MFNKKISELPIATVLTDNDVFSVLQADSTTRQVSFGNLIRGVNSVVEITFPDLRILIGDSGLVTGTSYQVDFQTKHLIPNTTVINTGTTETLLLYAVSANELLEEVISISYPQDVILLDIGNVLCEDGTTARDGKITYRKDSVKNLETWYDFRNVKFRRWKLDVASNSSLAWVASTSYSSGTVVYNVNTFYACLISHTSGGSFDDFNWQVIGYGDTIKNVAWNTSIPLQGHTLQANTGSFTDYLTFEHTDTHDISIKSMYDRSYNNIVFAKYNDTDYSFGLTIDENCYSMTFLGAHSENTIGKSCHEIIMGNDYGTNAERNTIASNCYQLYFGSVSDNTFSNSCHGITVINGSSQNTFEENAYNSMVESSVYCFLGKSSSYNKINYGSYYVKIGANSYSNIFTNSSQGNSVGDNCNTNIFNSSSNNFINDNSYRNTFTNSSYNSVGKSSPYNTFTNSNNNTLGSSSGSNTFTGTYLNVIGDSCYSNSMLSGSAKNRIANSSSTNSFTSSYDNTIGIDCYGNSFTNAEYNSVDSESGNNTFNNAAYNTIASDCFNNIIRNSSYYNCIGIQSAYNVIDSCDYCKIGLGSSNNSLTSSYQNTIGDYSFYNAFTGNSQFNTIGNGSSNNSFSSGCWSNTLLNQCSHNTFSNSSSNNSFGNNCNTNTLYSSSANSFGNSCSSNIVGDASYGGGSNNSFGNDCVSNSLWGGNNNNSLGNGCSNNNFGDGSSANILGNFCTNNLLAYHTGNSSGSFSNNRLGAGCTNINMRGNNIMFGEGCNSITLEYSANSQFAPGMSNKTFVSAQFSCAFLISDSAVKTYYNSNNSIVVDTKSPDGELWYKTIDNVGVITTAKLA